MTEKGLMKCIANLQLNHNN